MIGTGIDAAKAIAAKLSALSDFSALGQESAALCTNLLATVADPDFPGAVVPNVEAGRDLRMFVAASNMTAWRQLSPVLKAFAGPTLSSFDGLPEPLPRGNRVADILGQSQLASTGVIRLPFDVQTRFVALRALIRARETLARAPNLQRSASEPTSWLLACFQDHLNVGRPDAATDILGQLRRELRVDALNLKFLEIQRLATFGHWSAILDLPELANLCLARRPPAITALLLEGFYRVHLARSFDAGDIDGTRLLFETKVRPLAQPMLRLPVSPTLKQEGWRVYGLEAWIAPSRTDIAAALVDRRDMLGWIADQFEPNVAFEETKPTVGPAPLDDARHALIEVEAVESIDSLAAARAALAKLNPNELAHLREAEFFRSALQVTDHEAESSVPTSWIEWLAKAADPAFTSALDIARQGKDEWSVATSVRDPADTEALISALDRTQNDDLAADRTAQALPFLVAWLQRDPDFPQPALTPIYASLLTLTALSSARGNGAYESSQILVSALLTTGLDAKSYQALIADIQEIAGDGFGVDMIYWMLEIIEDFMRASAPDAKARETFLHSALSRMAPIYTRLTSLQRSAVAQLAQELGWTLQSIGVDPEVGVADDFASRIRGLRIAIYSLTESSSRQAKAAIEEVAPSAVVDCNADHAGTTRLRALAENADLFVMTWRSAKHAATDFIREHRASRPLLYAQGKGFSSILRAIQDHLSKSAKFQSSEGVR